MTLLERVRDLCKKNSIKPANLEKILKFGNGTLSRWDSSSPSIDKIQKVANYFNVSIDYLVGQEDSYTHENKPQRAKTSGAAKDFFSKFETGGKPKDFYAEFETIAEILGYKVHLKSGDMSSIEFKGKETQLKTNNVVNLMNTTKSFVKFTLQEAIKNADEEYGEDSSTYIVAARGGVYELDKDAAQKLAQSAAKAPNRAHDKNLV
ncbi:MAG: helix-turn-helix domain-containing protein [Anaerotignaceae bacterium]